MRSPNAILTSAISLTLTVGAALWLPLRFPAPEMGPVAPSIWIPVVIALALLVWAAQFWRVAIRGARGDVSISMAIDVATMLLMHPFVAAAGSALGTAMYHQFGPRKTTGNRTLRALIRGMVTFSAVALGGWLFRMLRPEPGPVIFAQDWIALSAGILLRLLIRVIFYPLGMAALRPSPVLEQLRKEWDKLPLIPYLLTTTLGAIAAIILQTQPPALVLLIGPLAALWAATGEFRRLNELLDNLEENVADRTARLAKTVKALERRLSEFEAVNAVVASMVKAVHPDEVLNTIAQQSAKVTGASSALVTLLSEDGRRQFIRATYGRGMAPYIGMELPVQDNLAGRVVLTGQVQVSFDPPNDTRLNQELVRAGTWRTVVQAPLRTKERVLGALVVATHEPNGFDEQHARLLALFGNQAGIFLENARLHEKEREVAVLEERNRLARELHDSVTQMLFSLSLNLEAAAGLMKRKPEKAAELVTRSGELASEALAEMRALIFELRPAALQEKGLANALANHTNLFRRRHNIAVNLSLEGEGRLDPDVEFCLYRVAQEALNNVAKHAKATEVSVSYSIRPDAAVLVVEDNGVGFDPSTAPGGQSFGLIGMDERVAEQNGTLTVESHPGKGTRITARIPLQGERKVGEHGNTGGEVR